MAVMRSESADARPDDVGRFLQTVRSHREFFAGGGPISVSRAPGRLDVMGGIADYSGSLVLQWPIASAAFCAAQLVDSETPMVTVRTTDPAAARGIDEVRVPLADLQGDYSAVRRRLGADPASRWAAYVLGAVTVLHRERGLRLTSGVRWLLASEVPAGKGVSSSAAVEVAAMCALLGLLAPADVPSAREIALLCQDVENMVVGAPCGVMDQMTATCGEHGRLLALRCQPAELEPSVRLPDEIEVYGIDSGIRHEVGGADYGSVRAAAFMGYRIIAAVAGLNVQQHDGRIEIDDSRWQGYLANVTPAEWKADFRHRVSVALVGARFLEDYGGTSDRVTRVDPERTYAVRAATAHPIYEQARVARFRELLQQPQSAATFEQLGALMYESHASYSACGLGSSGTDALVDLVRARAADGLYGAKITGGGSGGTIAVLARRGSRAIVEEVAARYERDSGRAASIIAGSSDGAARFGTLVLAPH
jgi:galactokinase